MGFSMFEEEEAARQTAETPQVAHTDTHTNFVPDTNTYTYTHTSSRPVTPGFIILFFALVLLPFALYYAYQWSKAGTTINNTDEDLQSGLIGHWTFDSLDVSDKIYDRTGNDYDGYITGSATSSMIATGQIGQSFKFDGVDDRVSINPITTGNTFTITVWIKPENQIAAYGHIFGRDENNAFQYTKGSRKMLMNYGGGYSFSNTTLKNDEWSHVAISVTGGNGTFYLNGKPDGTKNNIQSVLYDDIGSHGGEQFTGRIDDLRFYNRALSDTEMKVLYSMTKQTIIQTTQTPTNLETGLVGHWTFDGPKMAWASTTAEVLDSSASSIEGDAMNFDQKSVAIGKIGQGLVFDGSNDRVGFGNISTFNALATSTGCAWVKPRSLSSDDAIISQYYPSSNDGFLFMRDDVGSVSGRSEVFTIYLTDGGVGNRIESRANASMLNQWSHVCYTFTLNSANGLRLYIDGVEDPNSPASTVGIVSLSSPASFDIGTASSDAGLRESDMVTDDVRIYNRALSASEMKRLYELGATTHINTTIDTNDDLENGLVGHWTFDGPKMAWGSTTAEVLDSSGNRNNGDGSGVTPSSVAIGKIGQAVTFDGVDDYVSAADSTSFDTIQTNNIVSTALWVKTSQAGADDWFIAQYDGSGSSEDYVFGINTATLGTFLRDIGGWTSSGVNISDGKWHHVTSVFNGSNIKQYVDGVERSSTNVTVSMGSSAASWQIGFDPELAGSGMVGQIDDMRIYNRALSAAEVKRLYELGGGR